jgi:hypothetical protein
METITQAIQSGRITLQIAVDMEDSANAIARLDGRISASPVADAWRLRAAWNGYAQALRLQGVEIDEIDVFAWGCRIPLPHRPRRTSHLEEFDAFGPWVSTFNQGTRGAWRDALPFSPVVQTDWPVILRALDLTRQYSLQVGSAEPWLALPSFLRHLGFKDNLLPCLTGGAKMFRLRRTPTYDAVRASVRALGSSARAGIDSLNGMERHYRDARRILLTERRPGALVPLMALSLVQPALTPTSVAELLDLSLSGSGKLLERAASLGLVHEITGRSTWKTYLVPDLAIAFGFAPARRGRPATTESPPPFDKSLAAVLASFDQEMEAFAARFGVAGPTT